MFEELKIKQKLNIKKYCQFCGYELERGVCTNEDCNNNIESNVDQYIVCPTCGKKISNVGEFCTYCGVPFLFTENEKVKDETQGKNATDVLEYYLKDKRPRTLDEIITESFSLLNKKLVITLLFVLATVLIYKGVIGIIGNNDTKKTGNKYIKNEQISTISEIIDETITNIDFPQITNITLKKNWKKSDGFIYCFDDNDDPVVDEWIESEDEMGNKNKYYFDMEGKLVVNSWIDGEYFVGADGAMYVDKDSPDGAHLGPDGKVIIKPIIEEQDMQIYYEAPNGNEKQPTSVKSMNSGEIKGVDPDRTYDIYIKDILQCKTTVEKKGETCSITYYYPLIAGIDEREVETINNKVVEMFQGKFKTEIEQYIKDESLLPKSLVLNRVEQRTLTSNRFTFIISGRLLPRHGLYEKKKFRFAYDRKSKQFVVKDISE